MSRLRVRVTPSARSDAVSGWMGSSGGLKRSTGEAILKVRVKAPPERGKANDAVIALIARTLGVPESRVTIVRGATSRDKVLEIDGVSDSELCARLDAKCD